MNATLNNAIMSLSQLLQTEPESSLNHIIAQTVIRCMRDQRDVSTNYLAQTCNVSKTSITRFCRHLGFDTFADFKESLWSTESDMHRKYPSSMVSSQDFASRYLESVSQNCQWMKEHLDTSQLIRLAQEIESHNNICLLGNGQSGNSLNGFMLSLLVQGKYAQVSTMPQEQESIIQNMKPDTLVIILSIYGKFFDMYVDRSCFQKKPENSVVYLLTCNSNLPAPPGIDHTILCCPDPGFTGGNLAADMVLNLVLQYYRIRRLEE